MATETKKYATRTGAELDAYRAKRRAEREKQEAEERAQKAEHQARLDRIGEARLDAELGALSSHNAERLTAWARKQLQAKGYTKVRDDSPMLAKTRREMLREILATDMTMDDIEE